MARAQLSSHTKPMDSMGDILADTKRMRAEALTDIAAIEAGAKPLNGQAPAQAIATLRECVATYDEVIRRLGWRDNA